jgi:predicted secreted acid phosphatase
MFVIVCDIDETLCDSKKRRQKVINKYGTEEKWTDECVNEFLDPAAIRKDKVIPGAKNIIKIARACGKLFILTGRNERSRKETRKWLLKNLNITKDIPLIMRNNDDFLGPVECKENLFTQQVLKGHEDEKFVFFEDDPRIFSMFMKYGVVLKAPEIWAFLDMLMGAK